MSRKKKMSFIIVDIRVYVNSAVLCSEDTTVLNAHDSHHRFYICMQLTDLPNSPLLEIRRDFRNVNLPRECNGRLRTYSHSDEIMGAHKTRNHCCSFSRDSFLSTCSLVIEQADTCEPTLYFKQYCRQYFLKLYILIFQ